MLIAHGRASILLRKIDALWAHGRNSRFHSPDWRYAAISLGAQVGVRIDPPTLEAI